ncbi:MAG: uridine kinase [Gemmatimonadales bacterium]
MAKPVIIGVAGGSGSGKTTVVGEIVRNLGHDRVTIIQQDSYYYDRSEVPPDERAGINYDHPDSLETPLLIEHLKCLKEGTPVQVPRYDFANHARLAEPVTVAPRKVVILEGILILADADLRAMMDIKVFVDADSDLRIIRRIERDIAERGRTVESVVEQYLGSVRPMHLEFVDPSKRYADLIIPEGGRNQVAVDMLITKVREIVSA